MTEVADDGGGDDAKTVGNGGMKAGKGDEDVEKPGVEQGDPAIDEVALKIFLPAFTVRLEDDILVTEEGVCDSQDVRRNVEDEIVDARVQEVVQRRIDERSEEGVPTAHSQVAQGLVTRLAEKRQ